MSKKKRIRQLEQRVVDLEARLARHEQRSWWYPTYYPWHPYPSWYDTGTGYASNEITAGGSSTVIYPNNPLGPDWDTTAT
jgi:hypothetical protein